MRKQFFIFSLLVVTACSQVVENAPDQFVLKVAGSSADFAQTTIDNHGDVVAWWVEEETSTGDKYVFFSSSNASDLNFSESMKINTTKNLNPGHGESMPKLLVKPDGTYVLVYTKRNLDAEAMYASAVYYTQSFDKGINWTEAKLIHSDVNPENSHSFPETVLLPDGEVMAVWLDGRHKLPYSEMYMAKTQGKEGFGEDTMIAEPSCQCCKIDLFVDEDETLHLTYRAILEGGIRDIIHLTSTDNGTSFSQPNLVSEDNWKINACPHNGPSVTKYGSEFSAIWLTGGNEKPGVYFASSSDNGNSFDKGIKLTDSAKHLYLASLQGSVIAVWDQPFMTGDENYTRVKLTRLDSGMITEEYFLSPDGIEAAMPFALELPDGDVLVNWTEFSENGNTIQFKRFENQHTAASL